MIRNSPGPFIINEMGRERPKIRQGTLLTDRGTPMRGGVAEVYAYGKFTGKTAYVRDPKYYRALRSARLNAVRVVCSDPWQRSHQHPHADLGVNSERHAFLAELDAVVDLATANNLYVLIDYHDIGRLDLEHAMQFWQIVAPRYAAHPSVFFELANEPVSWHPESYTDEDLRKQETLYRYVRNLAPETHLVLLTFANTARELVPERNPVVDVIERMQGIDWSNASVGIHPYRTLSSKVLLEIQEHAPIVVTELDVPFHAGGLLDLYTQIDGAEYGHQPLERHGISWFGWGIEGPDNLKKNFVRGVLEDAKTKSYLWDLDSPLPRSFTAGSVIIRLFRQPAMQDALRSMGVKPRQVFACIGLAFAAAILDGAMLLSLLPLTTGAASGSFDYFWSQGLSGLRHSLPPGMTTYRGTFFTLAVFIFGLGCVRSGALYGLHLYVSRLYRIFSARLANAAFRRYLVFGKPFFDKHGAGQTASVLDYNHDLLNLLKKLLELISETAIVVIYLVVMLVISWKLTLVSLLVFPAMHLIRRWIAKRTSHAVAESHEKTLRVAAKSFDIHRAMPLFRAFTKEEAAARNHASLMEEIRRSDFYVWLFDGLLPRAQEITTLAALLFVLILAFALEGGQLSTVKLFVFFFVSRLALPRLSVFHEVELEFFKKMPHVELFLSLFNDNGKYIIPSNGKVFPPLQDAIYFQKLTFAYPDRDPILHKLSFTIPKGKTTAIVGPSGSGKTTIANLLLRYYDVAPHTIAIDGICIREFSPESIRQSISVVSQETMLLDDTLRANIVFGVEGTVSDADLRRVIQDAALEEVVASLPVGLDTPVGSDGVTLSGGQRQRVSLARAMLKQAPILILDEATSSLDIETEQAVQAALETAFEGSTRVVISHRMTAILQADHVVVLDAGRVAEAGSLQELLDCKGRFYEMWEAQVFFDMAASNVAPGAGPA
jgi:ATP-binding cassette, subfamily B, bacterial MsbA